MPKSKPAYYTNDELERLWPELAERPIYLALCKLAVTTGMRFGELAALRWPDVDLLSRELHVARTFTQGIGEGTPEVGGAAHGRSDTAGRDGARGVVRGETAATGWCSNARRGGNVSPGYVVDTSSTRRSSGLPSRGWASAAVSVTFTRSGTRSPGSRSKAVREITWVQRQLGHSSITLTVDTYGSWARSAEKREAQKLKGAFPV